MKIRPLLLSCIALTTLLVNPIAAFAGPWQTELERLETLPDNHITRSMKKLAAEKAEQEREQEASTQSNESSESAESSDTGSNVIDGPGCDNPLILC